MCRRLLAAVALAALAHPGEAAAVACRYDAFVAPDFVVAVDVRCNASVRGFQFIEPIIERYTDLTFPDPVRRQRARYRVDLDRLARERNDVGTALRAGRSILATGGSWLLRPVADEDVAIEVHVRTAPEIDVATGVAATDGILRLTARELEYVGFSAFGRLHRDRVIVPGRDRQDATIDLVFLDGALSLSRAEVTAWVDERARVVSAFWHGFPSARTMLAVIPRPGVRGIPFGRVMAGGGVSMALFIGDQADHAALADDWVLIHEFLHIGSPFLANGAWLMEGVATYLEPVIRARAGLRPAVETWHQFHRKMPRGAAAIASAGVAGSGFRGLYWGGAVLALLADVEIRKASAGTRGLEDCLRDVLKRFGNAARVIDVTDMIAACDQATGDDVLGRLVERYAYAANAVDLEGLWRDLGVRMEDRTVVLDDAAPLAWVRDAIVRGSLAVR